MRPRAALKIAALFALSALIYTMDELGDLYEILEIDEAASDREIKSAYRRLSLLHHPDKGGSSELFKEVSAAYEVLSDGEKRALYDAGGMAAVAKASSGEVDHWGRPVGVPRDKSVHITVNVPLNDMYQGGRVRAKVRRRVVCRGCSRASLEARRKRGKGADERCDACGPTCPPTVKIERRRVGMMLMNQEVLVNSEERCKEEVALLNATIEKGAPEGMEIVFERASEQTPGRIPGNVVLKLQANPHAVFKRVGNDLFMVLTISLKQALLGFEKEIRHLDGHPVKIVNRAISSPGQVIVVQGEGMPLHGVPSEFGNLHVELKVQMPEAITAEEREFVASHFLASRS
ncbi:hypothetical protein AB1Y20_008101 [Prymnesium parvum]|uniref:J domain-containing protein n=1 Tax=Prymnesium parvum TaxID=97485 RepID=A0AB34IVQ9_PRYPA